MSYELMKKQRELFHRSVYLRNINIEKATYEKHQEIKKEQTEAYNKYNFFKGLNAAMSKKESL